MPTDRIDSTAMLAKLSPKERVEAEDLVFEAAVRRDRARSRRPEFPPEVEKHLREQADAFVAAVGPLTREGAAAVRVAWREMARGILEREMDGAGPEPALATEDDGADA